MFSYVSCESQTDAIDIQGLHYHILATPVSSPFFVAIFIGFAYLAHRSCVCVAVQPSSFSLAVAVHQCLVMESVKVLRGFYCQQYYQKVIYFILPSVFVFQSVISSCVPLPLWLISPVFR